MEENIVTLKATVDGIILVLKEQEDFKTLLAQIDKKLTSAGRFFKGATFDVKYRGRKLTAEEEKRIVELMTDRTGAHIKSFEEDEYVPVEENMPENGVKTNKLRIKKFFFKGIEEGITKFYRGTVRSGQLISFDGNLVIIGDVNPGAEVEASGNVIVLGSLRGMVHAGADGNRDSIVVSLNFQPTQLRIADVITRPPDEQEVRNSIVPELAYVKDGMIYIDKFLPQFK